jgi:hypothetical protein
VYPYPIVSSEVERKNLEMSINQLVREEISRRADHAHRFGAEGDPAPEPVDRPSWAVKYIPAEVMALYVPCFAAVLSLQSEIATRVLLLIFGPIAFLMTLIIYIGKANMPVSAALMNLRTWPWWSLTTATLGYFIWALSLPNNTLIDPQIQQFVSTVGIAIVSVAFPFLEANLFVRR